MTIKKIADTFIERVRLNLNDSLKWQVTHETIWVFENQVPVRLISVIKTLHLS